MSWSFQKRPGFMDIVEYEGTGEAQEIPHKLGCKPGMILVKRISSGADWAVYNSGRGPNFATALNADRAEDSDKRYWDDTEPTDTHFRVGNGSMVSSYQEKYIAYLFGGHAYDGLDVSSVRCGVMSTSGGAGSSGVSVDCGWPAQFLLYKRVDNVESWKIMDRRVCAYPEGTADNGNVLEPNLNDPERNSYYNGFYPTDNGFTYYGGNEQRIIYMAIEAPPPPPPGPYGVKFSSSQEAIWTFDRGTAFPTNGDWTVEVWYKNTGTTKNAYDALFGSWASPINAGWMLGFNMNNTSGANDDLALMHGFTTTPTPIKS